LHAFSKSPLCYNKQTLPTPISNEPPNPPTSVASAPPETLFIGALTDLE
jgi:hypothetical protein